MVKEETSVSKRIKTLLIVAAGVVVLAVAAILLVLFLPKQEVAEELGDLYNIDYQQIRKLEIKNASDEYALERGADDKFKIVGHEKMLVSQNTVASVLSTLGTVSPRSKVEKITDETKKKYGLDNVKAKSVLTTVSGVRYELYLGNETPTGDGYYMMINDDDMIYTLPSRYITALEKTVEDMYDLFLGDLAKVSPQSGSSNSEYDLEYFKISGYDVYEPIYVKKAEASEIEDDSTLVLSSYKMIDPVNHPADADTLLEMYTYINSLEADAIIFEEYTIDKLKQIGVDFTNPAYILEYDMGEGKRTIKFSEPGSEGIRYVIKDGLPYLYAINEAKLTPLQYKPHQYAQKSLFSKDIYKIYKFEYDFLNGTKHYVTINGDNDDADFRFDGQKADFENFKQYYINLQGAMIIGSDIYSETYTKIFNIKLYNKDGSIDDYVFYKIDDRTAFYTYNGKGMFTMDMKTVEKLMADVDLIRTGERITSEW